MLSFYIGVDIGKEGAISIFKDGKIQTIKMPKIGTELDYHALFRIFEPFEGGRGMVVFEKLGVIFGSGKNVAFSMGYQAGAVEMVCVALSIPYTKVAAKEWQKDMFTGVDEISKPGKPNKKGEVKPIRDTKAMALVAIKRLFPDLKLTFGEKAMKPHDGLVDAVLMMEHSKRRFQ